MSARVVTPGSRAHLRGLAVEALRAQETARREAGTVAAQLRRDGLRHPARDRRQKNARQRAEALRQAAYWLETAVAFTPREDGPR